MDCGVDERREVDSRGGETALATSARVGDRAIGEIGARTVPIVCRREPAGHIGYGGVGGVPNRGVALELASRYARVVDSIAATDHVLFTDTIGKAEAGADVPLGVLKMRFATFPGAGAGKDQGAWNATRPRVGSVGIEGGKAVMLLRKGRLVIEPQPHAEGEFRCDLDIVVDPGSYVLLSWGKENRDLKVGVVHLA